MSSGIKIAVHKVRELKIVHILAFYHIATTNVFIVVRLFYR